MKWLKEYVDLTYQPKEFAERMTMTGSKVEGWSKEHEEITGVVIGKILSIDKHPDADKLLICQVDVGSQTLQIVTGAHNLIVGDIVPVATDGANLPGGVKIKRGKLRGVESNGMLCSIAELGLTKGDFPYAIEDGIFVIQEECALGQDAKEALGIDDDVVEFEITSNRPDCLSVLGLAREAANTFALPLKEHTPVVTECGGDIHNELKVTVDAPDLCTRYMAREVKDVKIAPSPRWMRERLRASGVRPINNIVDITNYVMLEYGQPMHAFDYRFVKDGSIHIRRAKAGEAITTLDGNARPLTEQMLCIADSEKPIAVAGVMGGEFSGILDDTTTVVFESACFNGASVRNTAKALGMRTDSSARFEKGLPAQLCPIALDRACELIAMLGAGRVVSGQIDVKNFDEAPITVTLEPEWTNRFLGTDLPETEMVDILTGLGFTVEGRTITVPYFRTDIHHKADIAEEIARIHGYDVIPDSAIKGKANGKLTTFQKFERTARNTMLAQGYSEIMTYSFISPKEYDLIGMAADDPMRTSVVIQNPLGEETSIMRTTALPSMLETLSLNFSRRNEAVRFYEIAKVYRPVAGEELPDERKILTLGAYGGNVDFFALKGAVEELLVRLNLPEAEFTAKTDDPAFHPGRTATLSIGGKEMGILGEIHPMVRERYGIRGRVYAAQLDLPLLFESQMPEKTYHPLPRFPSVTRDVAILCDRDLPVAKLRDVILRNVGKLLEK
ncbi:MAG: phenylalanine--tRNA ligase subunit beta, partial [Clostridia bacterium]|nr:phenylalanine--tRNA ligase subunit beta [Clostridia bacterium]